MNKVKHRKKIERIKISAAFLFCYLLVVDFQHTEKDLHEDMKGKDIERFHTCT